MKTLLAKLLNRFKGLEICALVSGVARIGCKFFCVFFVLGSLFLLNVASAYAVAQVKISSVNSLSLGTWSGSGSLSDNDDVCIYNSDTSNYSITASGSGSGQSFAMSGSGSSMAFEVWFKGSSGSVGTYSQLTSGSPENFSGANQTAVDCGGGVNANVKVSVGALTLGSVPAGSYSGSLTIVVTPR